MSDTLVCVAQRVGELADMTAPCSKSIGYGALLAALMLEFMLVILLLSDIAHARRHGALPTEGELARRPQKQERAGMEPDMGAWLLAVAARHIIDAPPQGRFIAVPVDGSQQARIDGERLVWMLRAGRPVYFNVPLEQTDRAWVNARSLDFGYAGSFQLHRWPAWGDAHHERAANRAPPTMVGNDGFSLKANSEANCTDH